jgi:hypothetical protein
MDTITIRAEWTLETVLERNGFAPKSVQLQKILHSRRALLKELLAMGYGHKGTELAPQERLLIDSCENRQTHVSIRVTTCITTQEKHVAARA